MQCCYRNFTQRSKVCCKAGSVDFYKLTTAFVNTLVYLLSTNKRSAVQLSKLKLSAFWNPKVTQLTKSRCGRCPQEQNTPAIDHLAVFLQLKKSTQGFLIMSSIQQNNNYNLNCLDTVFLVSTCNTTTLDYFGLHPQ